VSGSAPVGAVAGRGKLVVLEGPEGVGKTTQVARVRDQLAAAGVAVESYREPGGTPLGNAIRQLVLTPPEGIDVAPRAEALLFMAARAQLLSQVEERLRAGVHVVLDRFFLSTYAYQIVGRGLPAEEVRVANRLATGGLVPDLTILITCELDVAQGRMHARGELDRLEREDVDFHARVTHAFHAAADPRWQRAHPEVGPVVRVDGEGTEAAVTQRIVECLAGRWPETFRTLAESQQGLITRGI